MEKYRKVIDGRTIIKPRNQIVVVKNGKQYINPSHDILIEDGWEEYVPVVTPLTEEDIALQEAENKASEARGFLADTDYKVIKCMEAYLCGEALPYDINELHAERDERRRIINDNEDYGKSNL